MVVPTVRPARAVSAVSSWESESYAIDASLVAHSPHGRDGIVKRLSYILLTALLVLPRVSLAQKAGDDLQLAKQRFQLGLSYYNKARFAEAAAEFEASYNLSHRPDLLYNMGKAYQGAGDPARALGSYRKYLRQVPSFAPDYSDVQSRVAELERKVAIIAFEGEQPGSRVLVNQHEVGIAPLPTPLEVNPGDYQIDIECEGLATWRQSLHALAGNRTDVQVVQVSLVKIVAAPTEHTPVYKKWWLWTAVGVGVAAIAVGVGLGLGLTTHEVAPPGTSVTVPRVGSPTP
jgi:tetratricopeptide (TPR) repeat protein